MKIYNNIFNLKNKVAYVVGGLGLLGYEVIKKLNDNSATVICLDIDIPKKKIKKFFYLKKINFVFFDCTKLENIYEQLKKIFKNYGSPDIFVNCAYPSTADFPTSNFKDVKIKSLRDDINFQLISPVWLSKIFADEMKKNRLKGSLINISSIYSKVAQDQNNYIGTNEKINFPYPIIKGGLNAFNRQLASFYGPYGIRSNVLIVGAVDGFLKGVGKINKIFRKKFIKRTPLRRLCHSSEVAGSVVFLASDASSYITGSEIFIDGGYSIL